MNYYRRLFCMYSKRFVYFKNLLYLCNAIESRLQQQAVILLQKHIYLTAFAIISHSKKKS